MFGKTIDYWLLRPLAHRHKIATEEELDRAAEEDAILDMCLATARLRKWNQRLDNRIPLDPDLSYLDLGCGDGSLCLAFASAGCGHVTGIDVIPRAITRAKGYAESMDLQDRTEFHCLNVHDLPLDKKFDVILSHEMLEHVERPREFLNLLRELLNPNGRVILAFGPLFHSPFGDHQHFFRVPIPWRGVVFSEQALMRLRREFYRPTDPAISYEQIQGGLNRMRYTEFLRYIREAKWETELMVVNPQFQRIPPLFWLSNLIIRVPLLRDYWAASVYAIFRKPDHASDG